jgi:hypothetical protein
MPYHLESVPGGYYVVKDDDGNWMSSYPLSLARAKAQLLALYWVMHMELSRRRRRYDS